MRKCLYFVVLTTFQILGQNLSNFFVGILVQTMTPKIHFEIKWPLASKLEHSDAVLINLMHFLGPIASPSAQKASLPGPSTTKILYFTNRSSTPFMSAISRKIGEITLRDFKVLFDRPGFYRFHFKTVDEDYGMVKEEVIYLLISNIAY